MSDEDLLTLDSYVEIFNRFGDIELVHGGDDDGRCGEEEEQDEEDAVDDEAADPPGDPTQRQVLPAEEKNRLRIKCTLFEIWLGCYEESMWRTSGRSVGQERTKHSNCEREGPR